MASLRPYGRLRRTRASMDFANTVGASTDADVFGYRMPAQGEADLYRDRALDHVLDNRDFRPARQEQSGYLGLCKTHEVGVRRDEHQGLVPQHAGGRDPDHSSHCRQLRTSGRDMRGLLENFEGERGYHVQSRTVSNIECQGHVMSIEDFPYVRHIVDIMKEEYGPVEGLRVASSL